MILHMKGAAAASQPTGASVCSECGAGASGNFCSFCGADLRTPATGMLRAITAPVRYSFPAVYLRLLRSPVKATVALAEDPAYRAHVSFLLTGIAVYFLLFLPILLQMWALGGDTAKISPSMLTLMRIVFQVNLYLGAAITFSLGYAVFRHFAKEPRPLRSYFKLYCLAWGFIAPIYAIYEYVTRTVLGVTGMSTFNGPTMTLEQWARPSTMLAVVLILTQVAFFVAIHVRFWRMRLRWALPLYVAVVLVSNKISFWLSFYVGYWSAHVLSAYGIVHA